MLKSVIALANTICRGNEEVSHRKLQLISLVCQLDENEMDNLFHLISIGAREEGEG